MPVRQHVEAVFKVPVAFQNDANAAACGEYWAGAGRGTRSMGLFTLGTGIGGGIILDGRVVEGQHSHGAELGHLKIELTRPRLCGCGKRGCLEAYASAIAVVKRTREALAEDGGRSSLHALLQTRPELTARDVFTAAAAGDALADRIVEETAFYLALGASNLMHTIDPDVVVFAGGMTAAGESFLARIRRHVHEVAFPVPAERTQVRFVGPHLGGQGRTGRHGQQQNPDRARKHRRLPHLVFHSGACPLRGCSPDAPLPLTYRLP